MKFLKKGLSIWYNQKTKKLLKQLPIKQLHKLWFDGAGLGEIIWLKKVYSTGSILIDDQDEFGWTALTYAARNGDADIVAWLIEQGVSIKNKQKSFITAVRHGHLAIVQLLYATGDIDINEQDEKGVTPFLIAGNVEILRWLMQVGANLEVKNVYGQSAFLLVAKRRSVDSMKFLYDTDKFAINEIDAEGNNALLLAMLKACCKCRKSKDYIQQLQSLKLLIEAGIDVTCKNNKGTTAFMVAARHNNIEVMELLYATHKVDLDDQDISGCTALMYANHHAEQAVEKLLGWGANSLLKDKEGCTALDRVKIEFKFVKYAEFIQRALQVRALLEQAV